MNTKVAEWFEAKVTFGEMQENGMQAKVTRKYVIDAVAFGDAEDQAIGEAEAFAQDDVFIKSVQRASYREVIFSDSTTADLYYKVKVSLVTLDEKTSKEKRSNVTYLVQANSLEHARKQVEEYMGMGITDYEIVGITDAKVEDVIYKGEQ